MSVLNQDLIDDVRVHLDNIPRGGTIDPKQEIAELASGYSCEESDVREFYRSEATQRGVILLDD